MFIRVLSAALVGIEAQPVTVEVDLSVAERQYYHVVGLPDAAVRESGKRVLAAIRNSGWNLPHNGSITVNLAPAQFRKEGSCYDLPIALALLGLTGFRLPHYLNDWIVLGELSLEGRVLPVRGILPAALSARSHGLTHLLVPDDNVAEAAAVSQIRVHAAHSLNQVMHLLGLERPRHPPFHSETGNLKPDGTEKNLDLSDVRGQESANRALEVACAGGHNLLLLGPPGTGKSMLAKRIASLLPPMSVEEGLKTSAIHSVSGRTRGPALFLRERPFRAPHHSISQAAMAGGGSRPRPGEVSLAHNGVLFLDELPEFPRSVLEALRQPLEDGQITVCRAAESLSFPARFMLVAAMNPCPCGYISSAVRECFCTPAQVRRYLNRVSGPLLDRIDLHINVPEVAFADLSGSNGIETSSQVAGRIQKARLRQLHRFQRMQVYCNAQMGASEIRQYCQLDSNGKDLLQRAVQSLGLSARACHRILKVALTIADLEGVAAIKNTHLAEAIQYRSLDREQL